MKTQAERPSAFKQLLLVWCLIVPVLSFGIAVFYLGNPLRFVSVLLVIAAGSFTGLLVGSALRTLQASRSER